ncbi:MAG: SIS domain-containing protein [Thermomicrobiales bacterium]|nr:SIS domain-containing protein [Thermomicrobiales bacterium]
MGQHRFADRHTVLNDDIAGYWSELADLAAAIDPAPMAAAAAMLLDCRRRDRVVFIAGNGGSAASASHFACDLAKSTRAGGPPTFRVAALTDNVPLISAWANDTDYDRVFAEQLIALGRPGDLFVAISASGNSPNILAAAETARSRRMRVLGFTGRTGGRLVALCDLAVRIPADRIEVVEDAHIIAAHSLCVALREALASRDDAVIDAPPLLAPRSVSITA